MWVTTRRQMEETGISHQKKVFKYTLKQTKNRRQVEWLQLCLCCPKETFGLYCWVLCKNVLRWSPWSEKADFNYGRINSCYWLYLKIHRHVEVQHLASVLEEFISFKIQSSSFVPTICDKIACKVWVRARVCTLLSAFVRRACPRAVTLA